MKATDLRIGNLVMASDTDDIIEVFHLDEDSDSRSRINYMDSDNFRPIPLTEEILIKTGAQVFEFDNEQPNQYRLCDRIFVIRNGVITDYGSSTSIRTLHELQNFIKALTGQELEINL